SPMSTRVSQFAVSPPKAPKSLRQKQAPRKQKQQQERPEQTQRDGIEARRNTFPKEAHQVFVDEIEPQETANTSLRRVAQRGQHVPRRGDQKEDQRTGNEVKSGYQAEVAREQQKNANRGKWEYKTYEALYQYVQGASDREAPTIETRWCFSLSGTQKETVA